MKRVADAAALFFGCWQVYALTCVYGGFSFTALAAGAILVPLAAAGLAWFVALRSASGPAVDAPGRWADRRVICATAFLAALATLSLHRPDMDDAYYLNEVVATLAHPDLPVLSFDGMHGDVTVPIQQLVHRPQTYELLVALLGMTGLSPDFLYYTLLPVLFAFLATAVSAAFLEDLDRETASTALVLWLFVLLAWGDGHRTFANFAWVRLFQGKAIFLLVGVPLIVGSARDFLSSPDVRRFAVMSAATLGATAFTSSALLIAPVALGLALLAGLERPHWKAPFVGLGAVIPVCVVLLLVQWELHREGPLVSGGDLGGLWDVIGEGPRGIMALILVTLAPMLAWSRGAPWRWLARYVGLSWILVVSGLAGSLLATAAELFSWRLFWAVPFPLLVASSLATGLRAVRDGNGRTRGLGAAVVGCGVVFFAWGGWVFHGDNHTTFAFGVPRRPVKEDAVNRLILEKTEPDDLVLLPQYPASFLTSYPDAPRLVTVRHFYTKNLARHWGKDETKARLQLMDLVEDETGPKETEERLMGLERRRIDIVVTCCEALENEVLADGLMRLGYARSSLPKYDLWSR